MTNATGWDYLYQGHLVKAAYTLYDAALAGYAVGMLFILFEVILIIKTKNLPSAFVAGLLFASLYLTSTILTPYSAVIIIIMLLFELAGILYFIIFK